MLAESEGGQGPGGVPGVVPGGGCDVGVAGHFHDPDGEVAQGGHDLGAVSGADLGGVLAVGHVADVVQGFDAPVAADPPGEVGGAGLGDGQAGDPVGGDSPPPARGERPDAAGDGDGLGGVREGQPGRDGGGLDRAGLLAAVPAVALAVCGWDGAPGQVLDLGIQAGLVLLHDQDVAGVLAGHQELGVLALSVHRVRGDHAPGQVQRLQQRREPGDLVRLAVHGGLAEDGGRLLVADCHQVGGLPACAGVPGAAQRLAVHSQRPLPAPGLSARLPGGQRRPQPGAHRGIERASVDPLQHPADGRLIRGLKPPGQRITADAKSGKNLGRGIGDPFPDRGERACPGQHRRHGCQ
jgi:hypothetical protein